MTGLTSSTRAIAAAAVSALTILATVSTAEAAAVEVTKKEYKAVKLGMKPGKVTKIVGSKGTLDHGEPGPGNCWVKRYTGWNSQTVYFEFDDLDGDGVSTLAEKARLGPLGGITPTCPSVS